MYKVEHNKGNISIEQLHDQWTINGNIADTIKVKHTNKDELTIFKDGNEYIVRIHSMDTNEKELTLLINGKRQQYRVKEPVDLFLSQLGIDTFAKKVIKNIKAPMPGLVLKILVSKGDAVKEGDPLLILEAMKMENVFKAPHAAIIDEILIKEKMAVDKGQELISFQ